MSVSTAIRSGGRSSVSGLIVTVFGSTGFLGRYVVSKLGRTGSTVVVPYRSSELDFVHLKTSADVGQLVPIMSHMRHQKSIERAVSKSNIVINLVGKHYATKNFSIADANVESARSIATACANAPNVRRLIYMSSVHAREDSPSEGMRAKWEAEEVTRELMGDKATVIRATQCYGDEDRFFNRLGLISRFWPFIPKLPDRQVAPIYVRDAAEAIVAAAELDVGGTFEVEGARSYDQQELFETLCKVMQHRPRFVPLPEFVNNIGVRIMAQIRNPLMTPDEWKLIADDDVANGDKPGLGALGIEPTPMEQVAINTLRKYRPPISFYDIEDEESQAADLDTERRMAPRDFSRVKSEYDFSSRKSVTTN